MRISRLLEGAVILEKEFPFDEISSLLFAIFHFVHVDLLSYREMSRDSFLRSINSPGEMRSLLHGLPITEFGLSSGLNPLANCAKLCHLALTETSIGKCDIVKVSQRQKAMVQLRSLLEVA